MAACSQAPLEDQEQRQVSELLAPCAKDGKVSGSMKRTVAADGTVTYIFSPECRDKNNVTRLEPLQNQSGTE